MNGGRKCDLAERRTLVAGSNQNSAVTQRVAQQLACCFADLIEREHLIHYAGMSSCLVAHCPRGEVALEYTNFSVER